MLLSKLSCKIAIAKCKLYLELVLNDSSKHKVYVFLIYQTMSQPQLITDN